LSKHGGVQRGRSLLEKRRGGAAKDVPQTKIWKLWVVEVMRDRGGGNAKERHGNELAEGKKNRKGSE